MGLKVKLLVEGAKAPTVAHPGEDLGYDLYAAEPVVLYHDEVAIVRTGIAVEASYHLGLDHEVPLGLIIKDRSSMAAKGIFTHGGVIDAGYRGEIKVIMSLEDEETGHVVIGVGDKIAQMVPVRVLTQEVTVVDDLTAASRGDRGFGSSGQ